MTRHSHQSKFRQRKEGTLTSFLLYILGLESARMEFLTLQDVPRYHRSAMSVKDHGLPHHHAKQHEASERMRVSHVINPPSIPNSPSPSVTSSPSDPPSSPATSETLAHERSPHSRDAPRLCLSVRGKRRWVTPSPELELSGIPVLLEAANYQEDFYRKRKCVTPDPTPTPSVHDDASRPSRSPELTREYKEQPPSPSKRTERLPGYSEVRSRPYGFEVGR